MASSLIALPFLNDGLAPHFRITVAAVHRSPLSGLERYLTLTATRGAYSVKHLPRPIVAVATTLLLPGFSALKTSLGLISKAPAGE